MLLLVMLQIARRETFGQNLGLTKGKAQTFSGDGINGAGGIADEGNAALIDLSQLAG
jgi:hypothetical protein